MTQKFLKEMALSLQNVPMNICITNNYDTFTKTHILEGINHILSHIDSGYWYYETDDTFHFWLLSWLKVQEVSDRTSYSTYYKTYNIPVE